MRRRSFLGLSAAIALAGCSALADFRVRRMINDIEPTLEVLDWSVADGVVELRYRTSGSISLDVETIGLAYADAVNSGLSPDLRAVGTGASNTITIEIDRATAREYLNGPLSKDEYFETIRP